MKVIMMPCVAAILLGIIAVISGCGSDSIDPGNKDRMFLFGMINDPEGKEDFAAVTSDNSVIAVVNGQLAKPVDERTLHINGIIERGNVGHNLDWGWHFTPDQWVLAEISVEVCDGSPTLVEQDIDNWAGGRFCPHGSYVKSELTDFNCTMDVKQCPDGTYVGRIPPDCEFEPCPEEKAQ